MLSETTSRFLWNLFCLGLFGGESKGAIEWVASMHDPSLDLPSKVESLLSDYWSSGSRASLLALALVVLEGFCFDVEHRTRLTALLFADGSIDLDRAYSFLSFEGVRADDLQPSVRRVANTLWLLKQDAEARIMEPSGDSLLGEALRNVAEEELLLLKSAPH
jgi:hypothetical protein